MKMMYGTSCAVVGALLVAACGAPAQPEAEEEVAAAAAEVEAPAAQETEAFEVCDADGNRYPSEADAEAAGLDRAEYGATFCEFAE
ncbi:hypothetical protein [Qipengyuania gaetbuli]|uniref:hypothetical protein n=1 Tax=Qipengyuania gaetbuli TaxID=266952 RepID=UPI001CFD4C48|nr:hypothetical protein [Qipengyuania gaetbuli]